MKQSVMKKKDKPQYSMASNTAYMIALAWRQWKSVLIHCILLAVLAVAANLAELYIAPVILGKVETKAPLTELFLVIAFFTGTMILLRSLTAYLNEIKIYGTISLRTYLWNCIALKLATTSYPNLEDQTFQNNAERARSAASGGNSATQAIWGTLTRLIQSVLGFAVYLFLFYSVEPILMLITIASTVISYFVNKKTSEWGYCHREEEARYIRRMEYIINQTEGHAAQKDIRIFGMGKWLSDIFDAAQRLHLDFTLRGERVYFIGDLTDLVLTILRNGIAYFYLIHLVLRNGLSAAEFLLYFSAVSGFTTWITGILAGFFELHKFSLDLNSLRCFLETKEQFKFEDGKPLIPDTDQPYEIELQNVSFRYPGATEDTLRNINLKITPGEKLAIVGLNGAGKTTLVKLICGYYDPTEGVVLLNGEDIRHYNRRDYYRHFSAVFQEFSILATNFGENIAQDTQNIDSGRMEKALREADLTGKIKALPQGLGTHLGHSLYEDGVELSGGETQRLMLARALYKNAPIIVLDEPTAALDPISEHNLYMRYNALTRDRTSIYISHRLASTRFCNRILFLENGVIAEEGTHDSLLNANGKYAGLFEIQSQYYREKEGADHEEE